LLLLQKKKIVRSKADWKFCCSSVRDASAPSSNWISCSFLFKYRQCVQFEKRKNRHPTSISLLHAIHRAENMRTGTGLQCLVLLRIALWDDGVVVTITDYK